MEDKFREPLENPKTLNANGQTWVIDTLGFRSLTLHLFATAMTATLTYEQSNDGINWASVIGLDPAVLTTSAGTVSDSPAGSLNRVRVFSCLCRFFRVRVSAYTSGSVVGSAFLRTLDVEPAMPTIPLIAGPTQPVSGTVTTNTGLGTGAPGNTVSRIRAAAAANQDANLIKASAGNVSDIVLVNQAAAAKFVKFYNLATSPTSASAVFFTIPLRAGQEIVMNFSTPLRFGTGIGYRITNLIADADATAVTADDVHGLISWA